MRTAKILYNDTVFEVSAVDALATQAESLNAPDRARRIFASPVLKLIESIYELYPDEARYILREPIWLSHEPTDYEKALIKVTAKRFRVEGVGGDTCEAVTDGMRVVRVELEASIKASGGELRPLPAGESFASQAEAVEWFRRRSAATGIMVAYFSAHHLLRVLAQNTNSRIKTRHAEMNMIRHSEDLRPQNGDYIVVSLQSCRMCAAALADWIGNTDVKIYYLAAEPNLENVKTALFDRESLIK